MSLLRIYCPLRNPPRRCRWALVENGTRIAAGEGDLGEVPRHAGRVQIVVPAPDVLLARVRLPPGAKHRSEPVLGFAVEEVTAGDPDSSRVKWLGASGEFDVLAVMDRRGLAHWHDALGAAGIAAYEIQPEILLLPRAAGEWSLAWNGREGYARTAEFEGVATDCGDRDSPPESLSLLLAEAAARDERPASIAIYTSSQDEAPDTGAWARRLGVPVHLAGAWDWRTAEDAGKAMAGEARSWGTLPRILTRLRPAAWIAGVALGLHALALGAQVALLGHERQVLREQMEARFRAAFPDTVSVVDPALQMRRKLAQARRASDEPDAGDFLPMLAQVATGATGWPHGALRVLSYESGRMTIELGAPGVPLSRGIEDRLVKAGMSVRTAGSTQGGGAVTMTVVAP